MAPAQHRPLTLPTLPRCRRSARWAAAATVSVWRALGMSSTGRVARHASHARRTQARCCVLGHPHPPSRAGAHSNTLSNTSISPPPSNPSSSFSVPPLCSPPPPPPRPPSFSPNTLFTATHTPLNLAHPDALAMPATSPPHIRIPSPAPAPAPLSAVPSATPIRPHSAAAAAAADDLLAPAPASSSSSARTPRSTSPWSADPQRTLGLSPGLDLGGMLASPSFAPEMRISAACPGTRSPTARRSRSPSYFRLPHGNASPPPPAVAASLTHPSYSSPSDLPQALPPAAPSPDATAADNPARLPSLDSLLTESARKRKLRSRSVSAHPLDPAESESWNRGDASPPNSHELDLVLDPHDHRAHSHTTSAQPAAPKIGASDGRFDSVMTLYSPGDSRHSKIVQSQPYASSLSLFAPAPSSGTGAKSSAGPMSAYPRVAGLSGLGLSFPADSMTWHPTSQVEWMPRADMHTDHSALPSPGLLTPASQDTGSMIRSHVPLNSPITGLSVPSYQSNGLTPVLDRVSLATTSPPSSAGSMCTLPSPLVPEQLSPAATQVPALHPTDEPTKQPLSRSFSAAQSALSMAPAAPSTRTTGGSFRQLSKSRSNALVQSTAKAFEAHRATKGRSMAKADVDEASTGVEDSPWGMFSLNPKKISGWKPLFPPGIRPPVLAPSVLRDAGSAQAEGQDADMPSPAKRARLSRPNAATTARSTAKAADKPKSNSASRVQASKSSKLPKLSKSSKPKPTLSMKNVNRVTA